jgi:hypothetical protein
LCLSAYHACAELLQLQEVLLWYAQAAAVPCALVLAVRISAEGAGATMFLQQIRARMSSDGGELDTQGRRGAHAKLLCFDASVFSLECTSTAQPYRARPSRIWHGPQLACKCSAALILGGERALPVGCASSSRIRELAQQTQCRASKPSIVSAWTWQELAQLEVLVIYRTHAARAV